MKNLSLLFPIGLFFCTAITVNAEVYKTTNADGSVSYSDSPSQNSTKINVLPSAVGNTSKQASTSKSSPAASTNAGEVNMPSANDVKPVTSPQPAKAAGSNQSKATSTSGSSSSGGGGASAKGGGGSGSSSGSTARASTTTVAPKAAASASAANTTTGNTTTGNTTTGNTTTGNTTTGNTTTGNTTTGNTTTGNTTTGNTTTGNTTTGNTTNSLAKLLSALTILQKDMVVENEGIPEGSDKFAWAYKPTLIMGYNPTASGIPSWYPGKRFAVWDRALGWVTAYREKGAANPVNTRLALKDFYLYYFSKSKKQWVLLEYLPNIKEDYRGEANMEVTNAPSTFDVRTESDGIKSYKMAPGSWFHTYGYLKNFELSDFGGLYYRFDFKLVLDNPKGPNTLNSDKWLVQSGADYYPVEYPKESLGAPYNPGVGTGRFLRAGPQWRTSTFLVMTPPYTLSQYPPNLDNFYE